MRPSFQLSREPASAEAHLTMVNIRKGVDVPEQSEEQHEMNRQKYEGTWN